MFYSEKDDREKQLRFSIRKVSFGAASVAVAALYLFMGSGAVSAAEAQAVQSNEEVAADKDSETEKKSEDPQLTYAAPAAKKQGSATNTEAGDEGKQESHPGTKEEEVNSSERSETTTKTQSDENSVSGDSSSPKSEGEGTKSEEASSKPKVRKRRDTDSALTATATYDDPAANQTYQAPSEGANVEELAKKLKELPDTVENEKKLSNIDQVGATKNISSGQVSKLNEFGGWKAVSKDGVEGKFAVARKTDNGVFPIETVNTVISNNKFRTYLDESSFDRSQDYALFLGEVRTEKTKNEPVFDNTRYQKYDNGNRGNKGKGIVGYNGIEKTFKAYSSSTGTGVTIAFRTGFTGDIDGNKAGYKVEVMAKSGDGSILTLYTESFKPTDTIDNDKKKVTKVDARGNQTFDSNMTPVPTRDVLNQKLGEDSNKRRLGRGFGTFQSKGIELPTGVTEYTVRISALDNNKLGMGYQIPWEHYALPVVGTGFSVTQDTRKVAKDLSQKVYDKLTESKEEDTKWSTPETKAAYEEKLKKIKDKLDSEASTTSNYREVVGDAVAKWKELNEGQKIKDKAKKAIADKLTEKEEAIENNSNLSPAEKEAAKKEAKAEADKAKQAIENAQTQNEVTEKETEGTAAIGNVNPIGTDNAKNAIAEAAAKKMAEIEDNDKLSEDEKTAAKEKVEAAVTKAAQAIREAKDAKNQDGVNNAQADAVSKVTAINPVGKDKAKADLEKAAETEKAEINADTSLTATEKEQKVKDLEAKLAEEKGKIDTAADADAVAKAKESGEAAIRGVHTNGDLEALKNAAKADL
ncbi:DUF1542 domain-containing protein, partial [Streptococcus pseudopneumoniae]|uniref:DUF1542 domain-containing protein n=1 Tax=Streptococcus pseudopneumoniae TaxID=257758 RepID=UPI0018B0A9C0